LGIYLRSHGFSSVLLGENIVVFDACAFIVDFMLFEKLPFPGLKCNVRFDAHPSAFLVIRRIS